MMDPDQLDQYPQGHPPGGGHPPHQRPHPVGHPGHAALLGHPGHLGHPGGHPGYSGGMKRPPIYSWEFAKRVKVENENDHLEQRVENYSTTKMNEAHMMKNNIHPSQEINNTMKKGSFYDEKQDMARASASTQQEFLRALASSTQDILRASASSNQDMSRVLASTQDMSRASASSNQDVSRTLASTQDMSRVLASTQDMSRAIASSTLDVSRASASSNQEVVRALASTQDMSRALASTQDMSRASASSTQDVSRALASSMQEMSRASASTQEMSRVSASTQDLSRALASTQDISRSSASSSLDMSRASASTQDVSREIASIQDVSRISTSTAQDVSRASASSSQNQQHMQHSHYNNERPNVMEIACQICNELIKFGSKDVLYLHYIRHFEPQILETNLGSGGLVCIYCRQQFPGHHNLVQHLGITHNKLDELLPYYMQFETIVQSMNFSAPKTGGRSTDVKSNSDNSEHEKRTQEPKTNSDTIDKEKRVKESRSRINAKERMMDLYDGKTDIEAIEKDRKMYESKSIEDLLKEKKMYEEMLSSRVKEEVFDIDESDVANAEAEAEAEEDALLDNLEDTPMEISQGRCKICNYIVKFQDKRHLYKHYIKHYKDALIMINQGHEHHCTFCGKKMADKNSMFIHVSITHNKLESMLPPDMRWEHIIGGEVAGLDKDAACFKLLLTKLNLPPEKEIKTYKFKNKATTVFFIDCRTCCQLVVGERASIMKHLIGHYQDKILEKYPDGMTCQLCYTISKKRANLALHYGFTHGLAEQVIPADELVLTECADVLEDDDVLSICKALENGKRSDRELKFSPSVTKLIAKLGWSADNVLIIKSGLLDASQVFVVCQLCQKLIIGSKSALQSHVISHYKDQILGYPDIERCSSCSNTSKLSKGLTDHYAIDHGIAEKVIPAEELNFVKISDYLSGGKVKDETVNYGPVILKLIAKLGWPKDKVNLLKTRNDNELTNVFIICEHCDKLVIGQNTYIKRHAIYHYKEQILSVPIKDKCKVCETYYNKNNVLAVHVATEHKLADVIIPPNQFNPVRIQEYLETDKSLAELQKEILNRKDKLENSKPSSAFSKKNKKSKSKSSNLDLSNFLNVEIDESHLKKEKGHKSDDSGANQLKLISCQICQAIVKFKGRTDLYRHYVKHYKKMIAETNEDFKLQCSYCGKKWRDNNDLYCHIGVTHNKVEELLPDNMKFDHIMATGSYRDHSELSNLKKELSEGSEFNPVVTQLIASLGLPEEKVKLVSSNIIANHMFIVCQYCEKLIIGKNSNVKRHLICHYKDEILSHPFEDRCDKCENFKKSGVPLAMHLGEGHGVAEKVIPSDQLNFIKISDYFRLNGVADGIKTEELESEDDSEDVGGGTQEGMRRTRIKIKIEDPEINPSDEDYEEAAEDEDFNLDDYSNSYSTKRGRNKNKRKRKRKSGKVRKKSKKYDDSDEEDSASDSDWD